MLCKLCDFIVIDNAKIPILCDKCLEENHLINKVYCINLCSNKCCKKHIKTNIKNKYIKWYTLIIKSHINYECNKCIELRYFNRKRYRSYFYENDINYKKQKYLN